MTTCRNSWGFLEAREVKVTMLGSEAKKPPRSRMRPWLGVRRKRAMVRAQAGSHISRKSAKEPDSSGKVEMEFQRGLKVTGNAESGQ